MALVLEETAGDLIPDRVAIEAQHGPVVALQHPDDERVFGFKVISPETFALYEARKARGETEAMAMLMQERACYPSRDDWNKYVAAAVFETLTFEAGYRHAQGGAAVRVCDADEIPEDGNPEWKWLTNRKGGAAGQTFGFRKPGRAEVKQFQSQIVARGRGEKVGDPIETLIRACGTAEFSAWLTANPFGGDTFGESFVGAYGMTEARVSPK